MKRLAKMALYVLAGIIVLGCSPEPASVPVPNSASEPTAAPANPQPATVSEPSPAVPIETVSDAIGATVAAAVEVAAVIAEPRIVPPPALPVLDADCVDLLVRLEVGSVNLYHQRYYRPVHPSAESGVTIGLGYDMRFVNEAQFRADWKDHPQLERLVASVGLYGSAADAAVSQLRDVVTPFELAKTVFLHSTAPIYYQISRRQFGMRGFDALDRDFQCGLFLITINRGGAMSGIRRTELRAIQQECVPAANKPCGAAENRKSKRHWMGTDIERGMNLRREAESVRIERKAA